MAEERNTLDVVPVINDGVVTIFNDDGLVTITCSRYKKAWQVKLFVSKKRKNEIKLDFDTNGSAVWKLIDGKRTVRQILAELEEVAQGQEQFPQRVGMFLQSLVQNDLIRVED
jgi:Coenzyme PQQ synthesis protein D (PqqD).